MASFHVMPLGYASCSWRCRRLETQAAMERRHPLTFPTACTCVGPGDSLPPLFIPRYFCCSTAQVLSVGPGRVTSTGTKIPIGVKEGDIVVIPEYGGMSLKMDGEDLHVYRDEDIIGIVKE
eukprot:GHVU01232774.1.p1 GENE.GHVU01232774.1~~GHVU01232774.1.p1  ORF type:complete len:121 (-),score=6.83 GHVU01232774.1:780-1142(-)